MPVRPVPCSISLLVVLAVLVIATPAAAQSRTTSAIRGTVLREDGTPLPGAWARLEHGETGLTRTAVANDNGAFLFLLLQPGGPYAVTVGHLGYAEERVEGLELRVGQTDVVEIVLRTQAIEVAGIEVDVERAVAAVFDSDLVGTSLVLDERQIETTPLISRNLIELTALSPLVRTTEQGGFSIAGQNDRYNTLLIDGVLNKDLFGLTAGGVPGAQAGARLLPLDAVAQYEVLAAPFDIRLSGFTGGVMNAVTRTGTNELRGRANASIRTDAMIGDLTLPSGPVDASGVQRTVLGLSLGGPIVRDRAHFFVAAEHERRTQPPHGYNLVRDPASVIRITPEAAEELVGVAEDQYGLAPGEIGPYALDRNLTSVFGRVDVTLSNAHRLTVRNVFAAAENDEAPNRAAFDPYGLGSNAVLRRSATNTTSVQLFSDLEGIGGNELTLSVHRSWDETRPAGAGPQVEIDLLSSLDGTNWLRPVRMGAEYFAQDNDLDQTSVRLTDSFTLVDEGGTTTLGATGAWHGIRHRYLPAAQGHFQFTRLETFRDNRPIRYERGVLAEGAAPAVDLGVIEWGVYAQHQIATRLGLTMRFGIRLDVPHVLDNPGRNVDMLDWFGVDTSDVPSGMFMLSPRWGFNWQSEGERRWQVRGGAGLFTGQIPYVWLASAFHQDGLRSFTQMCIGTSEEDSPAPPLVAGSEPPACFNPITGELSVPFRTGRSVTAFRNGFTFPQELKFSVAADRELTRSLAASLTAIFSHAINQVVLREENLDGPSGDIGDVSGFGGAHGRRYFGRASSPDPVVPNRLVDGYEQVLVATNENQGWSMALSAELKGRLTDRIAFQGGYSFSRSYDHMSLVSADMVSNFGFNPVDVDPNGPDLRPSNFDRPHKIVASLHGAPFPGLPDTEISLLYTGQSGLPFSYVYGDDLNGDGYPGVGPAFDRFNDLIYVPDRASELPVGFATLALIESALESDACLAANRGRILRRNECRAPWQNRLDLQASQTLRAMGTEIRLQADVVNVLNLVNGEWGRVETIRPVVPLIDLQRAPRTPFGWPDMTARWGGGVLPQRTDEGRLLPTEPWTVATPDSQWQVQVGASVSFGRGR